MYVCTLEKVSKKIEEFMENLVYFTIEKNNPEEYDKTRVNVLFTRAFLHIEE